MPRTMKDSGVEWIGEIPEGWETKRCKYLASVQAGFPFDSRLFTMNEGFPLIRIRDITSGNLETYYSGDVLPEYVVRRGNLLIGMDGDFKARIWDNEDALLNQRCCRVITDDGILLHYLALSLPFQLNITNELAYSTTVKHLSNGDILNATIPLPPEHTRTKIVSYVEARVREIEVIIAKTQESIEEYKKLKQAVITQAVTKGIRPGRVMKDSGVEWIGEIPEEWELRKLKYAVSVRNEKSHFSPSSGLYIGLENLGSMRSDITPSDSQYDEGDYASCESGDVLYSKLRPYLCKCIISPVGACCTGEFLVIKSFVGLKEYLRYYLLGTEWTKNVTASTYGAKMPRANETFILNQMCLIPSVEEQQEIAAYLDEKCAAIDTLIEKKQAIITELEAYKKSLIYEYVTGKKEVPAAPEAALFK